MGESMRGHPFEPGSATGQARTFFESNPGIELTPHELSSRLGLTKMQAYTVIRNLKAQGVCESVRVVRLKKVAA